jgi:hypothetical protein
VEHYLSPFLQKKSEIKDVVKALIMLITSLGSKSSDPTKEVAFSHCQTFINYYFLPK